MKGTWRATVGLLMVVAASAFLFGCFGQWITSSPGMGRGMVDGLFYWNWVWKFTGVVTAATAFAVTGFAMFVRSADA